MGDSPPLRWTACGPVDPWLRTKTTAFAHARVRLDHCVSRGLPDSSLRARPSDPFRSYDHHPLALGFGGLYHASVRERRPSILEDGASHRRTARLPGSKSTSDGARRPAAGNRRQQTSLDPAHVPRYTEKGNISKGITLVTTAIGMTKLANS